MTGQSRTRGLTLEQRVWRWLRKQEGPSRVQDIVAHFDLTKPSATKALQRLVEKGCVKRTGRTWGTRYVATGVDPDDLRGTAPNTLLTLAKHTAANITTRPT